MRLRQRQSGMSIPGMLIIAIMAGFYVMCIIKLAPHYFDYFTVRDVVTQVSSEHQPGTTTTAEMRRRIGNLFNTNQVYALKNTDVEIFKKKGKTFIDARYEARVPIIGRIDAVLRFDDLLFVAGEGEPVASDG